MILSPKAQQPHTRDSAGSQGRLSKLAERAQQVRRSSTADEAHRKSIRVGFSLISHHTRADAPPVAEPPIPAQALVAR